ncbi:hypothetical protein DL96DRAFT_880188 [Flagelloscypha sp. PMI_526]|nr:hypothetical protein DL96DRAFT_880188 [Flagelloscypha sp. PMI_526]
MVGKLHHEERDLENGQNLQQLLLLLPEGGLGYPAVTVPPPPPPAEGYLSIAETDGLLSRVRPPPPFLATSATAAPSLHPCFHQHSSYSSYRSPRNLSCSQHPCSQTLTTQDQSYPSPSIGYPSPIPQHQHQTPATSSNVVVLVAPSFSWSQSPNGRTRLCIRGKMELHIRQIRDFCDGLEYNLQFGDQRMLSELERRGSGFLELVRECLAREGRLVS